MFTVGLKRQCEECISDNVDDIEKNQPPTKIRKTKQVHKCDRCEYTCDRVSQLTNHIRYKHTKEKPHQCDRCDSRFVTKIDLKMHQKQVHDKEKPFKCSHCDYTCALKSNLTRHIKYVHLKEKYPKHQNIKEKKIHKCIYCDYITKYSHHLVVHTRQHTKEKPFKCDYIGCKYTSISGSSLKQHKLIHTKEKTFKCDYIGCLYECTSNGNLKRHKLIHTGEKPFKCNYNNCNYECTSSGNLQIHKRTHTGEKPFKCDFNNCNYVCTLSSNLIKHKRIHTNETPYICDIKGCGYKCKDNSHLTRHKRTHTGERPFECITCGNKFTSRDGMNIHMRIHSGAKDFACHFPMCTYKCNSNGNLKKHEKALHSEQGQKRQKKEEEKIDKLFRKNEIVFDRELQVDFKCAFGNDRGQKCAKIDFTIHKGDTLFLQEIDEHEHDWYDQSCETRRMMDTYTSLLIANPGIKHIVWIRYNPNSFEIDEVKQKVSTKNRQQKLLEILNTYKATKPMEILYMYYSSRWSDTLQDFIPIIFDDSDYASELKTLCNIIE